MKNWNLYGDAQSFQKANSFPRKEKPSCIHSEHLCTHISTPFVPYQHFSHKPPPKPDIPHRAQRITAFIFQSRVRFSALHSGDTVILIKYLTSTCLSLLPLWSTLLVLFPAQVPWEEKNKSNMGPSWSFFLTSHTLYTSISRCWDMGCSSCFLSHFKVYWLFRRWKLHSRLLELKAVCLSFDQNQIFFYQVECMVRWGLWAFPTAAHIPSSVLTLALCNRKIKQLPDSIFPAEENTTVLQVSLKPKEGLKWDSSALIFVSRSIKAELVTPGFLLM